MVQTVAAAGTGATTTGGLRMAFVGGSAGESATAAAGSDVINCARRREYSGYWVCAPPCDASNGSPARVAYSSCFEPSG